MAKEIKTEEDLDEIWSALTAYSHSSFSYEKILRELKQLTADLGTHLAAMEREGKILKEYGIYSTNELIKKLIPKHD